MGTMTRAQIRTFARILLAEPSAARWTDTTLNNLIDYGHEDFCFQTKCLQDIDTQSVVASQEQYSLPSDYLEIKRLEIRNASTIYKIIPADLSEYWDSTIPTTGTPAFYRIFMEKLWIRPRASSSDQTTTLSGALASGATTITVASTSGFSSVGRLTINSEVVNYTGTTSTTFTGVTRGIEGSIDAAGSSGDTVTQRGIWIYFTKKPSLLSGDSSTLETPSQFDRAIGYYTAWHARLQSRDYDLAAKHEQDYGNLVLQGKDWIKTFWKGKVFTTK